MSETWNVDDGSDNDELGVLVEISKLGQWALMLVQRGVPMMAAAKNDGVNFAEDHISEMLHHVP